MRFRDTLILGTCLVLAAVLLVAAGLQLDYINAKRKEMKLVINEPLENAPPSLAFATVAMGAFRGLVVDILWIRADKLKEQGQFFDARQLAEWITMLQPRFPAVWEFHAWNMAYNISVAIPATQPDQRWRWVKNGYELLRDKGIPLNPKAIGLYRELGRIFQHKIGGVSDDAHKYYKLQLALAIQPLLGPADNAYFDALVQAPRTWEEVCTDPNVAALVQALAEADSSFLPEEPQKFVSSYLSLRWNARRFSAAAAEVIDQARGTAALKKFDIFARAYQLRHEWKLEPELMRELNQTYGPIDWTDPNIHLPLDWRHPDSHSLYWAVKGLKVTSQEQGREIGAEETNTDRMVAHSLQNLFRYGKIYIYETPLPAAQQGPGEVNEPRVYREIFLRPDLRMFEPYNKAVMAILEKYKDSDREGRYESLQNGHRNMLKNALFMFYQAGHKRQAQRIYSMLRKLYPLPEFEVPLVEWARKRLLDELDRIGINDAREQVIALLREAYYLYAIHDDDAAFGRESLSREIHQYYQSRFEDEHRVDLPKFERLRYFALIDFLNDLQYPPFVRQGLLARIQVERPELFKQLQQEEERFKKEIGQAPQSG